MDAWKNEGDAMGFVDPLFNTDIFDGRGRAAVLILKSGKEVDGLVVTSNAYPALVSIRQLKNVLIIVRRSEVAAIVVRSKP